MEDYNKKYEDAIERCKKEFNFNNLAYSHEEIRERLERVFPELKESEDERIRNELMSLFQDGIDCVNHHYTGSDCRRWLSWLEKQGKKDSQVILPTFTFDDILALQCCMKKVQKDEELYNQLQILHDRLHDAYWLEKQGDQKTDKIEPKFHAGDFITDGERIFQIKETIWERNNRNDGTTYCESLIVNLRDGNTYANNTDLKEYHLWTIQDAKDGDVLVYKGEIFLLKTYTLWHKIVYHCCLHNHSIYESLKKEDFENIHPADQEQRDLLFTKIKESGYEWDAEKKELKKIEDESTWSEEDIRNLQDIDSILFYDRRLTEDVRTRLRDSLKSLKDRVLPQPKSTWSEEGESHIGRILSYLESFKAYNIPHIEPIKKEIDWLKSLKERMKGE